MTPVTCSYLVRLLKKQVLVSLYSYIGIVDIFFFLGNSTEINKVWVVLPQNEKVQSCFAISTISLKYWNAFYEVKKLKHY